jgi:hypothetical protein
VKVVSDGWVFNSLNLRIIYVVGSIQSRSDGPPAWQIDGHRGRIDRVEAFIVNGEGQFVGDFFDVTYGVTICYMCIFSLS